MSTGGVHAARPGSAESGGRAEGRQQHSTPVERETIGKEARREVPRETHAGFEVAPDRNPLGLLEEQGATRVPDLVPIRYGRMLVSPFTFYRGAAAIMAHDLGGAPRSCLKAQLCGDAHLANFGGFASPERDLVYDVNDFDETLPGPFEWDLKRLATSFEVAGRDRGFTDVERRSSVLEVVHSYRKAMHAFAGQRNIEVWYARLDAERFEGELREKHDRKDAKAFDHDLAKARTKDSLKALDKLTAIVDGEPRIVSDPPLIVRLAELEGDDSGNPLELLLGAVRLYGRSLPNDRRELFQSYRVVDVARKVVGVGSVGTRCWIVLLLGRDGDDPLFLQVKEAGPSVLEPLLGGSAFANHGQRVVEGQLLMQATSDVLLGWLHVPDGLEGPGRDFYVRQLWDWKTSVDLDTILPEGLLVYARICGWTLARAHARSGDRIAIAAYLGNGDEFDRAVAQFAHAYADLNERDHQALADAARSGAIVATKGQ